MKDLSWLASTWSLATAIILLPFPHADGIDFLPYLLCIINS